MISCAPGNSSISSSIAFSLCYYSLSSSAISSIGSSLGSISLGLEKHSFINETDENCHSVCCPLASSHLSFSLAAQERNQYAMARA